MQKLRRGLHAVLRMRDDRAAFRGLSRKYNMSKEYYTAREVYDGRIGVAMPGTEYVLTVEEAWRLRDSLNALLPTASCKCGHTAFSHLGRLCRAIGCDCGGFTTTANE